MKQIFFAALLLLVFTACRQERQPTDTVRSLYYWQTTLRLDSAERAFIRTHRVKRLYMRYFDVAPDDTGAPAPNATLTFADSLPRGLEVVPTVFIVNRFAHADPRLMGERILQRVMQMNETHGVSGVRELQVDCDWTASTERQYFDLLSHLRRLCHRHGMKLSATIRLHQLALAPPPVDRGTLMMYNTGDVTRLDVEKPILDLRDAAPYLGHLSAYPLPLNAAYPLFTWRLLFRQARFVGIMHRDDNLPVLPGDSIVTRRPTLHDILSARQAIDRLRREVNREVILYHLSETNIRRFKTQDYENIYH